MFQRFEFIETHFGNNSFQHSTANNNVSSLNNMADCAIPLDNMAALKEFENKISEVCAFRSNLVSNL